ncbi:hypothetical protein EVG20_g11277 [Dentipellis fragilis]|uniref:Uncharacterized protein n=1 Tax=Dentipellis fragilis TaxID=205917 RepID=A0A4Y9XNU1_9AGAM|nr:hypothetical protein EVG20_g11277 [Dentipellis fragilis]
MGRQTLRATRPRRSPAQKAQIQLINDRRKTLQENVSPPPATASLPPKKSKPGILQSLQHIKDRATQHHKAFRNEKKKALRAKNMNTYLKARIHTLETDMQRLGAEAARQSTMDLELGSSEKAKPTDPSTQQEVEKLKQKLALAETKKAELQKRNHALHMRALRAPQQKAIAKEKAFSKGAEVREERRTYFVQKGRVIQDSTRDLVRELVSLGIPASAIDLTIHRVAEALGVSTEGNVSTRSVGRIVLEGGVASELQIVEDVQQSKGITLSCDGTTHRHTNYESRQAVVIKTNGERATHFLGVESAIDHTSESQRAGWERLVECLYETFNASPRAAEQFADPRDFIIKVTGLHTDHAEDQKKLFRLLEIWKQRTEREVHGEQALKTMASEDVLKATWEATQRTIEAVGGLDRWEQLSASEKEALHRTAYRDVMITLGEKAFAELSDTKKKEVNLLVWTGCCAHKDLNAVKGGNAKMVAWWEENGQVAPIKLMNKDNARTVANGRSAASDQALEVSQGGAVKLTSLAGAIFNHKDDKKGQQDTLRWFFLDELDRIINFPDTSNTRYQSHCRAAAELLVHRELYLEFLGIVKDKKEKRNFNHMEYNVFNGLQDIPTIHELAVLTLYSQAISHPYLREIRASHEEANALDFGPLHSRVIAHCRAIINCPDLLLASDATYRTGTLDGQNWDRPESIYAVQRLLPSLPHLRGLLVAFFEGALETWERFSSEFAAGGTISMLSPESRARAWMEATNDKNEGNLGAYRVSQRKNPSMTIHQYNARVAYKKNKTGAYLKSTLRPVDRRFLRKRARAIDASKLEAKRKRAQVEHDRLVVREKRRKDVEREAKKAKKAAALAAIQPCLDIEKIKSGQMTVAQLELQLAWHRQNDKTIKSNSQLRYKQDKINALLYAVEQFLQRPFTGESSLVAACEGEGSAEAAAAGDADWSKDVPLESDCDSDFDDE